MASNFTAGIEDRVHCAKGRVRLNKWTTPRNYSPRLKCWNWWLLLCWGIFRKGGAASNSSPWMRITSLIWFKWCYWGTSAQWSRLILFGSLGLQVWTAKTLLSNNRKQFTSNPFRLYVSYSWLLMSAPVYTTHRLMGRWNNTIGPGGHDALLCLR